MRTVIMGAPGAGKGTQSVRLARSWKVPHVSTGELLREAVKLGSDLGRRVKETLASGRLVSDAMMVDLLRERLAHPDCRSGFVLDGYPRTLKQVEDLDALLASMGSALDATLLIEVPDDTLLHRLSGRRSCPSCQRVYHVDQIGRRDGAVCERCGTGLTVRDDDKESTVRRRLQVYHEQTRPVLDHYRRQGNLKTVDGRGTPDEVYDRLTSLAQMANG
ncbi:MAG: adenylate kinase [Acidobacteriota bacterium]